MKKIIILFVILTQMAFPSLCFSGGSFSESFTLSVTIPAIIGLNVPDPNVLDSTPTQLASLVTSNTETQLIESAAVRDHQNITLRTLVVR